MSCGDKGINMGKDRGHSPTESINLHSLVDCSAECYFLLSANVLNSFANCGKHRNDTQKEEKFMICKLLIQVVYSKKLLMIQDEVLYSFP